MAIQPIDLQNMYSQISNIAKNVAGQQQAAQLSESIQQQNQIQKNIENAQKVQQTNNEKANTNNVNKDGHQGGGGTYKNPNKNKGNNQDTPVSVDVNKAEKAGYIGTIIDITR